MKDHSLRYHAAVIAVSMLVGCAGASSELSPQAVPTASLKHATHGNSWIQPHSTSGDLLYATGGCGGTCVLSYPGLKLVGELSDGGSAICADSRGNVFLPKDTEVVEFAHGGASPVTTLTFPGYLAVGCSVDPTTNNLAVV